MLWIDWVIIGVIVLSAGISLLRGFVREALALVGWILAFFIAKMFFKDFSSLLGDVIEIQSVRYAVSWLVLFCITLIISGLVNYIINRVVQKVELNGLDRVMGIAFGLFRGLLIVSITIFVLREFTLVAQDKWWKKSVTIPYAETFGDWFYEKVEQEAPNLAKKISKKIPQKSEKEIE